MTLGSPDSGNEGGEIAFNDGISGGNAPETDAETGSSPAEGQEGPSSLAEALVQAMQPAGEGADGASPDPEKGAEGDPDAEKAEEKPKELTEEEAKQLPFNQHPRWKEIYGERNELRQAKAELEQQNQQLQSANTTLVAIQDYLERNSLSGQDFDRGLEIMAMIRTKPEQAYDHLLKVVDDLGVRLGKKLPEDLEEETEDGRITPERAKELAQLRTGQKDKEAQEAQRRQREADEAKTAQQTSLRQAAAAVSQLEKGWMANDAEYSRIAPFVAEAFELWLVKEVNRTGQIPTQDQAVAKATELRQEQMKRIGKLVGQSRPATPKPKQSGSSAPARESERPAKSLSEHLARTMRGMYAA